MQQEKHESNSGGISGEDLCKAKKRFAYRLGTIKAMPLKNADQNKVMDALMGAVEVPRATGANVKNFLKNKAIGYYMKTKTYNQIANDDLINAVRQIISKKALGLAVITVIYTKNQQNNWNFLIGKCEFSNKLLDVEEIYSDAAFVRKSVSNFNLEEFLISLNGDGYKISDNLPLLSNSARNTVAWREELMPSNVAIYKYPERIYSARISTETNFRDGVLLGYDSGFQTSAREYVKKFMGLGMYHGQSHGDNGELSISIPDHRGRIVINEERISIDGLLEDIRLVGSLSGIEPISLAKGDTVIASKSSINQAELWLLTNKNEILDFRSLIEGNGGISSVDSEDEKCARILALIDRGEGHETEFKQYIDLIDRKNRKAEDFEKTVCALSNTKGGYLFVGVDDDACVIGVDDKAIAHYKSGISEALEKYKKDITKRLREKLRYNQCFDVSHVKIGGCHVVVVLVERTEKPNYFVNTDFAYIRKGATSAKMKSSDEREQNISPLYNF